MIVGCAELEILRQIIFNPMNQFVQLSDVNSVSSALKAMVWATSGCTLHFLLFFTPILFSKEWMQ